MNKIYLSAGAFIGRKNGFDHTLLRDYKNKFDCDGFEFMFFEKFYGMLPQIIADYGGINIPAVHADKKIGGMASSPGEAEYSEALRLFEINCRAAERLGAEKIIVHLWGTPDSDKDNALIYGRAGGLLEIALKHGLVFCAENIFCVYGSPLRHLEKTAEMYPEMNYIIDTRSAQFHGELEKTYRSKLWDGRVRHIHINDYAGGYMNWNAINPILQPGNGEVDWERFFGFLNGSGYDGMITLEATATLESGADTATLNKSLAFIKNHLRNGGGKPNDLH